MPLSRAQILRHLVKKEKEEKREKPTTAGLQIVTLYLTLL